MRLLDVLSARERFGIKPGLETISALCAALGNPEKRLGTTIHIAGTNGKGATAAFIDAALRSSGRTCARYTSPHLVSVNERFFLDGAPASDDILDDASARVEKAISASSDAPVTFFEALTAVAFDVFSRCRCDYVVLETGLGGRLDATNVCRSDLCVITRIGLDHCDILGSTIHEIASEKAGIIKPGVPVVLGANSSEVRSIVEEAARSKNSPFFYAPDMVSDGELPEKVSIGGSFNRENAVTALAALKVLASRDSALDAEKMKNGFSSAVWPGRYQKCGRVLVDGAHNPPAARALVEAIGRDGEVTLPLTLVAGFCGDKDIDETLSILRRVADKAIAVKSRNPRAVSPSVLSGKMRNSGFEVLGEYGSIDEVPLSPEVGPADTLVCGSLFLAGEALVRLGAYPWASARMDPNETTSLQTVIAVASRIFGVPPQSLSGSTSYGSEGWDSVNHLRLVMEAEQALGTFYPIEIIPSIKTLQDLARFAKSRRKGDRK